MNFFPYAEVSTFVSDPNYMALSVIYWNLHFGTIFIQFDIQNNTSRLAWTLNGTEVTVADLSTLADSHKSVN